MKRHNIKVYPLAIQVILGNLSHQKAVVIILSTRRQAATQLLYYPRVNKLGENIKIMWHLECYPQSLGAETERNLEIS